MWLSKFHAFIISQQEKEIQTHENQNIRHLERGEGQPG
jgi:hypothetical protein